MASRKHPLPRLLLYPQTRRLTVALADAKALPYADHAFDTVLSSIGVMFAPHHQQAANELVRTRGGVPGLLHGALRPHHCRLPEPRR
ncbi:MAG TPA: methyltransferase domain-containing protein [Beutenbergiaceae bacterium]|nr:methyltransferase domain-containing protein [Beutenbergiaceae bacterium]